MIEVVEETVAAGLRALPDWRGKANIALGWKRLRERREHLTGVWEIPLSDGSTLWGPRGAQMTWAVAATGYWDRHVVELVGGYVRPETLVLDVGAALGLWTLPLARIARERQCRLWCFEPYPDNLPWLTANIERNGLSDVTEMHSVALGSRSGEAHVFYGEHGGGNAVLADRETPGSTPVPVVRVDDLDLPRTVSFVKLDVEGFELEVLRGAEAMIARDRPVIFGEFSSGWLDLRGEDLAPFLVSLAELGYQVLRVEDTRSAAWRPKDVATLRRLAPPFEDAGENLLLVPEGRQARGDLAPRVRRRSSPAACGKWNLVARFPSREQRCETSALRASWRIAASILRRNLAFASVAKVDLGTVRVRADLRTPLGASLYRYGFCTREARLLRRLLRRGDVFVDGGANVGLFSLFGAAVVGPEGRVLACEPSPGTMAMLEANAAENDFDMLQLHEVALSDRTGSERFFVFEDGSGLASFMPEATDGTPVVVAVTTLDDLTSDFGARVALVKLDLEGAEVKAIQGAGHLLDRAAPLLLVEVEPEHLARQGSSVEELRRELEPRGYGAYAITEAGLAKLRGPWQPPDPDCPNLLLAPPSRKERLAGLISSGASRGAETRARTSSPPT